MNFLVELGFDETEVKNFENNIPSDLYNVLVDQKKLVAENIKYLKNLGITNYREIFYKFYELFLQDVSVFKESLEDYEPESLISKLNDNINVFEYL